MQYVDEVMKYFEHKDDSESKIFLLRLISKWKTFLLCALVGSGLAALVYVLLPKVYTVHSSIFVHVNPNENKGDLFSKDLRFLEKSNIQNNVELLKAFTLNRQAIVNLERNVAWYEKGIFIDKEIYSDAPFIIKENSGKNYTNVPIFIEQINDNEYHLKVDHTAKLFDDTKLHIKVDEKGQFGVPIANEYFHFTIDKNDNSAEKKSNIYFIFNDIDKLTLNYMKKTKVIVSEKNAEFIHLKINCREPLRGINFLNELTNVYLRFSLYEKNKKSEHTVQFIDSQLAGVADSLERSGKKFSNFKSENRIVNIGEKGTAMAAKIQNLETELAQNKLSLKYYQKLLTEITQKRLGRVKAPSVVGVNDPSVNTLISKLIELNSRRKTLSFSVQEDNPKLKILDNEIDFIVKSLEENLRKLMESNKATIYSILGRIKSFKEQLTKLPRSEQTMNSMKVQYELDNELYTFLMKKRAEAAIAKASTFSDSQVIDPASRATTVKKSPKLLFSLGIGVFLGLALPFFVLLIGAFFDDTVRTEGDVRSRSSMPVFAHIRHSEDPDLLPIVSNSHSVAAESIRTLRAGLRRISDKDKGNVIAIHSALHNEGKTYIACNLAAALAMSNKKILLIDADMRKHNVVEIFKSRKNKGLSDYLRNNCSINDIVSATDVANLDCIVNSEIPENPVELLENGKLEKMLVELKKEYDFIFIDNAPLMVVADGYSTAKITDTNLFILREGYSQKKEISYLNNLKENEMIDHAMIVLNDMSYRGLGFIKPSNGKDVNNRLLKKVKTMF